MTEADDRNIGWELAPMVSPKQGPVPYEEDDRIRADQIVAALRTVFDPEIPVNIYDLGLVYRVELLPERQVEIDMTLTAPGCPVAGELVRLVQTAVRSVDGISRVSVNLVFDPPWDQSMMSEEAKLELGFI